MVKPELHDPRVLRAIAHPARSRILTELSASGPMRAADVARVLGIPANQASFHLRQLAKYGLVEEDPEAARDRRDRVWRPTYEHGVSIQLKEVEDAPGGRAAAAVFMRSKAAEGHRYVDLAHGSDRPPDTHRSVSSQAVRLTKAEAAELAAEVQEVADRWTERNRGTADDGRRTYLLYEILMPFPDDHAGAAEH